MYVQPNGIINTTELRTFLATTNFQTLLQKVLSHTPVYCSDNGRLKAPTRAHNTQSYTQNSFSQRSGPEMKWIVCSVFGQGSTVGRRSPPTRRSILYEKTDVWIRISSYIPYMEIHLVSVRNGAVWLCAWAARMYFMITLADAECVAKTFNVLVAEVQYEAKTKKNKKYIICTNIHKRWGEIYCIWPK